MPGSGRRAPCSGAPNSGRRFSTRSSRASSAPRNAVYFTLGGAQELFHSFGATRRRYPAASLERSEEHTSELQSRSDLVCRLLLEKKKKKHSTARHARRIDASVLHL